MGARFAWPTRDAHDKVVYRAIFASPSVRVDRLLRTSLANFLMASSYPISISSSSAWDDPVLEPYAAKEASIEDNALDDEEEVDRQLIAVWREAVHIHPGCAGAYLRLASALRDAKQHHQAAEVLRQGMLMGHPSLLEHLIADYPDLVANSEIEQALGQPSLVKGALLAMLLQDHTDAALQTVSKLVQAQVQARETLPFPFREVMRLVGTLIQENRLVEAQQVQQLLASLHHPDLPQVFPRLVEIAHTHTWLDADLRSGLVQLELHGTGAPLECCLELRSTGQRAKFFGTLQAQCPLLSAHHQAALRELRQAALGHRSLSVGLLVALAVFGSTAWWLLTHP